MVDETPRHEGRDRRETARVVAALILVALLVAFVIDNTRKVTVGFVVGDHETRLIYVLIVTFLVGIIVDRLWQRVRRRH
ncbi:MAG: hypothetical protein QOG65_3361 [Actinomycetota bacterium]|nr:hypothetical protein [Actinomycetota bacterium]MDQ1385982.1 hypothetical protein [Actinomycetota bacterium]